MSKIYVQTEKGGAIDDAGGAIINGELTKRQIEILIIILKNPSITYRDISKQLNINESVVLKHINKLKQL
jgi:ATP-dependent DNA helicase RecG